MATMTPSPSRRRRVRKTPPVVWAVVITLGLHVNFVLGLMLLGWLGWMDGPPRARPVQAVGIQSLTPEQWAKNRGEPAKEATRPSPQQVADAKPKEPPKQEPEPMPNGKHVTVGPGNGEVDPDAKFVAETNNKVQKETRAKDASPVFRNPASKRTTTVPDQGGGANDRAQQAGNNGLGNDDRPQSDAAEAQKLAVEIPDVKARDEVKLDAPKDDGGSGVAVANRTESAEIRGNSDRLRLQDGDPMEGREGSQGRAGQAGVLNLTPSMGVLDSIEGSPAADVLAEDAEDGDGTYLNTREWKYSSFFTRLKQSIGMTWNPSRELRERDPSGKLYSGRDRHTVLEVTLDAKGRIRDIYVAKSCGLDFLDLEAMRAFERAQPFPNPPAGLLKADSTVTFKFGFFIEVDRGPGLRMFRPN